MPKQRVYDVRIELHRQLIHGFAGIERQCDSCNIGCTMGCKECDVTATCDECTLTFCSPDCEVKDDCTGCKCYGCDGCPFLLGR